MSISLIKLYWLTIALTGLLCKSNAQQRLALLKKECNQMAVFDSPKEGASVLFVIDNNSFFYCDSIIGNFYSFEMPLVSENVLLGYIHKDSVQLFSLLPMLCQKDTFSRAFNKFFEIINADEKKLQVQSTWIHDSTFYVSYRDIYYNNKFYPLLADFSRYYQKTSDVPTLLKVFKLTPYGDGEFATQLNELYYSCYIHNKPMFLRALKKVRGAKYYQSAVATLKASFEIHSVRLGISKQNAAEQKALDRL